MLTLLIGTTVLALFYGLAWHNQPAHEHQQTRATADVRRDGATGPSRSASNARRTSYQSLPDHERVADPAGTSTLPPAKASADL